jgi:hypothetical protein
MSGELRQALLLPTILCSFLVLFQAARQRSEETMRFNQFDSNVLGNHQNGQGTVSAVENTHRATLRILVSKIARRISLRLGSWRALAIKRMAAAGTTPGTTAAVVTATCPSYSASRRQRDQRWMLGVVVDPGTVGVC